MVMATPGAREVGVLERCHRNYLETFWQYLRLVPGAARRDLPDATLIRCDLPSTIGNALFFTNPTSTPRERLLEARSFFGPRLPWRVITSGTRASEVGREAAHLGLRPGTAEPGMLLDPIPSIPPAPPSLTIRPVTDAESLADFGTVWSEAFRIPRWVLPVALPSVPPDDPERAAQNRFFVGYVDRRPMTCSTVTVTERVAGVASVGTVPAARQRGLGTAVTWAAVDAGRVLGAEVSYLAATPMGYPVYARMGFRRVAEYPSWHVSFGFFRMLRAVWTVRRLVRKQQIARSRSISTGPTS
jgi:GNAT superfamily N-acetyltransferase